MSLSLSLSHCLLPSFPLSLILLCLSSSTFHYFLIASVFSFFFTKHLLFFFLHPTDITLSTSLPSSRPAHFSLPVE